MPKALTLSATLFIIVFLVLASRSIATRCGHATLRQPGLVTLAQNSSGLVTVCTQVDPWSWDGQTQVAYIDGVGPNTVEKVTCLSPTDRKGLLYHQTLSEARVAISRAHFVGAPQLYLPGAPAAVSCVLYSRVQFILSGATRSGRPMTLVSYFE